ncbi:MAG: hypothetical protein LBU47_03730 [Christensenellaceae bacterium]|nr:hypothetical protein [Christensenellaceae bacterium]
MKSEKSRLILGAALLLGCLALIGPFASFNALRSLDQKLVSLLLGLGLALGLWRLGLMRRVGSWPALLLSLLLGLAVLFYGYSVQEGVFAPLPTSDSLYNPTSLPSGQLAGLALGLVALRLVQSLLQREKKPFDVLEFSLILGVTLLCCLELVMRDALSQIWLKQIRHAGARMDASAQSYVNWPGLLLSYLYGAFLLLFFGQNRRGGLLCAGIGGVLCLLNLLFNLLFAGLIRGFEAFLPPTANSVYMALLFGGLYAARREKATENA